MAPDKERAEAIIQEILRQAKGGLGKTKLYKAFWLAHLYFAKEVRGYLSDWPIVRMPQGPGIHSGDELLREMLQMGILRSEPVSVGPFPEMRYFIRVPSDVSALNFAEVQAIREALDFIEEQGSAKAISDWSHDFSRTWRKANNGEELNIYSDLIEESEYESRMQELAEMRKTYEGLFG